MPLDHPQAAWSSAPARKALLIIVAVGALVIVAANTAHDLLQITFREPLAVQTSRQAGCAMPGDGEQLLIQVIPLDKQRVGFRCSYVTSRGQYRQTTRGLRL